LQRRIFFLLFLIAGVLLSQSVQAQEKGLLADAGKGQDLLVPTSPPTYSFGPPPPNSGAIFVVYAHDGGILTGPGDLTLNVTGDNFRGLYALGTGSKIEILGQYVINMTSMDVISRGVQADTGGTVILK